MSESFDPKLAELMEPSAAAALVRGEMDSQIVTAKRFPRSPEKCIERATGLATTSVPVAEACFYKLPRDNKHIEGGTIRLAEILMTCWGNIKAGSRTIAEGERAVTVQGVCLDLETNVSVSKEVRRRITTKNGSRYSDDMINMTVNAAQSIALRNAVFGCIPRALWEPALAKIKAVIRGDEKTLPERRARMIDAFAVLSPPAPADIVCRLVKRTRPADITLDDLVDLRGMYSAIRDGETTIKSLLAEIDGGDEAQDGGEPAPVGDAVKSAAENIKKGLAGKAPPGPPPAPENETTTAGKPPVTQCTPEQYEQVKALYDTLTSKEREAARIEFGWGVVTELKSWSMARVDEVLAALQGFAEQQKGRAK